LNVSAIAQLWFVIGFLVVVFLFPTGQPVSGRWWVVIWACVSVAVLEALVLVTSSQTLRSGVFPPLLDLEPPGLVETGRLIFGVLAIGGTIIHVIVRFARSRGVERQQLKWFALTFVFGVMVLMAPWSENDLVGTALWTVVPMAILTSIAIAILRYRLYDIDRIISRTVTYGLVVAVLAAVYATGVFAVQAVSPASGNLGVAASTLAAAALFAPLRRRVQQWVDQRFDRRRYDAQRVVEQFAHRLRTEVNMGDLSRDLQTVVVETMQPAAISMWLPESEER
ncbi:MAG: hypothetical protein ACRDVL_11735, partial [Acidimicrobiia bacterium]